MERSFRSDTLIPIYKNSCITSSLDQGFSESLQTSRYKLNETKDTSKILDEVQDCFEESTENVSLPKYSLAKSSSKNRQNIKSPTYCISRDKSYVSSGFYETPRASKKHASLRRQLLVSKTVSEGRKGHARSSLESRDYSCRRVDSLEDGSLHSSLDSPEKDNFVALATSTLKNEESTASGVKRFLFSQIRTSTLEDLENEKNPPLALSLSEIQHDLDESIISSFQCDSVSPELFITPQLNKFSKSYPDQFLTPVGNLVDSFNLNLSVLTTPPVTPIAEIDTSTTEDSGFNSVGLHKSQDSFMDHDGSFQELLHSRDKETSQSFESKRRSRLERNRRLSTLREGGSQSEEEAVSNGKNSRAAVFKCHKKEDHIPKEDADLFINKVPNNKGILNLTDLSQTPALQVMHTICLRGVRSQHAKTPGENVFDFSESFELFQPSASLAGLIGRKMGLKHIDILAELKYRNLKHILALILNRLSPEDIYSFGQVSLVWDEIILQDKIIRRRRRAYIKELKAIAKQDNRSHMPDTETRLNVQNRSPLKSVQAQQRLSSSMTPVLTLTPLNGTNRKVVNSASKQDAFIMVAKTLLNDECLKSCPRCRYPAKCHKEKKQGICSWEECAFDFCTECLRAFHGSKECETFSVQRRSNKEALPGSAKSKRNLKRL
ncbi:F-box only protein 43 [Erpetoichthys calabaricus]|uniref:F-box only protein 43 n=1 Tax=Erpetoichthys calabaricus TaxID=27687 RepID=UPI0022341425|nr:F-box only protein 43 [Erpetoichthys calabaricus]XP_028673148.2 F-box only protein 43 [Erpetoichthys calabaricus]XP_028673150.2 F-box only protein 43 [Erpetoichthys calabaricus]XP_028673151.2 F-box only protein 43 [Erpetoichthys calabaricus]XP_028673152.2 F-box only protein 43 [Erpetoichthys calabaricus]XP_051791814.1 F-box only protein 43 [Erpetoichthys calabaricus]